MTNAKPKPRSTKKIDWNVEPYVGVGPIRFGMSAAEVAETLGPPQKRIERARGFIEFREEIVKTTPVISYEAGKVVLIDFYKLAKALRFGELALFKDERQAIIDRLVERSSNVIETFEGVDFVDFGLTMSSARNFRENPNIGAFRKGHIDALWRRGFETGRARRLKGAD